MKKLSVLFILLIIFSLPTFAIPIGELFGLDQTNIEVVVKGEVIGDVMKRSNHAWVNIKDDTGAIGLWLTKSQTSTIKVAGDYKNNGDIIEVKGTFNKQCAIHGGDTDIHVNEIKIIKEGSARDTGLKAHQLPLAIITGIIFMFVYMARSYILRKTILI